MGSSGDDMFFTLLLFMCLGIAGLISVFAEKGNKLRVFFAMGMISFVILWVLTYSSLFSK